MLLLLQFRVAAPTLINPLRLLYPLLLPFVCSGSFCSCCSFSACCSSGCSFLPSSAFFRMLRLRLLLPVFLLVFPHAAASTAPSSLSQRFPLAASPAAFLAFAVPPVVLLVEGSPNAAPQGSVCTSLHFLLFLIVRTFAAFFRFSSVCFLGQLALPLCLLLLMLCLRFSSLQLRFVLSQYTLLSVKCRCYYLWCFCLIRISGSLRDVVSLWDELGFAVASVSLSSQGCFMWWYPFLYRSPFCSFDSFASKVLLATWSPFGMSLA